MCSALLSDLNLFSRHMWRYHTINSKLRLTWIWWKMSKLILSWKFAKASSPLLLVSDKKLRKIYLSKYIMLFI